MTEWTDEQIIITLKVAQEADGGCSVCVEDCMRTFLDNMERSQWERIMVLEKEHLSDTCGYKDRSDLYYHLMQKDG